jgi:hypothetical protein
MKSELTLKIEDALKWYRPAVMGGFDISLARDRHMAFEVPAVSGTSLGGLIDAVEITEYMKILPERRICMWGFSKSAYSDAEGVRPEICKKNYSEARHGCDEAACTWNTSSYVKEDDMLVICYEIKVSKSDFASRHGHNLVGNLNYYVMPHRLYPEVKDKIKDGIGVITLANNGNGLRKKIDSGYTDIGHEAQKWLMLTVMKKNSLQARRCMTCLHSKS